MEDAGVNKISSAAALQCRVVGKDCVVSCDTLHDSPEQGVESCPRWINKEVCYEHEFDCVCRRRES